MQQNSVLHVIVGESPCANPGIRYRRHRFAEYVREQPTTAAVFWVYRDKSGSTAGSASSPTKPDRLSDGVQEFAIASGRSIARFVEPLHRDQLEPVARSVRSHPAPKRVLWFTVPAYDGLLGACAWDHVAYDCSDYWGGIRRSGSLKTRVHARLKARLRSRSEARIVRGSRLLFASSTFLAETLTRSFGRDAILVENGVDVEGFLHAEPARFKGELPPQPRLVFTGSLKERKIDFDLLHAVACAAPEYNLVLIGPAEKHMPGLESVLELPNVTWLGSRDPDEIPGLLKMMDLGLLPYRDIAYNEGVFPLKLFEYVAAGLPVVGCGLPATRHRVEDGVYVHTEATPDAFVAACRAALRWEGAAARRVEVAEENDWQPKLARMHEEVIKSLGVADVSLRSRSLP